MKQIEIDKNKYQEAKEKMLESLNIIFDVSLSQGLSIPDDTIELFEYFSKSIFNSEMTNVIEIKFKKVKNTNK